MAAQTPYAVFMQVFVPQGAPAALSSLPNPLSLDLIQIYGQGGNCLVRVSSTGAVTTNTSSQTSEALYGRFTSRLPSTASLANIMLDTFDNQPSPAYLSNNADIFQVKSANGQTGIYHLDYQGNGVSS
jgi:hypothetical protein